MDNIDYVIITVDGKEKKEHVHIMEQYLGRKLRKDEVVHHIDGNKRNNDLKNLKLMKKKEHDALHCKDRVKPRFTDADKEVIELMCLMGHTHREIMAMTGISYRYLYTLKARFRAEQEERLAA